jgi:hypothetical protein
LRHSFPARRTTAARPAGCFKNRNLTVSTVSLFVFIIAFMGAGLLFPSYFLQVAASRRCTPAC